MTTFTDPYMYFEFSWIDCFVSCATESYKKVVVNFKKWTVNSIVQLQIKINAKASYKPTCYKQS